MVPLSYAPAAPLEIRAEELLFRRQFLLGPRFATGLEHWQRTRVGNRYRLTAHPDLGLVQESDGETELTLLGYLLDPDAPELDDSGILRRLLAAATRVSDLFELTARLGGRWVLIARDAEQTLLFTDPGGLRQVVYLREGGAAGGGDLWCATQPQLLVEQVGVEVDPASEAFVRSPYYQRRAQPWWPGDATLYAGVKHLLPNHFLDLRTGEVRRFWPAAPRRELAFADGVARSAELLERLMASAHRRFPLALGITSGQDSRVLLAASRRICRDIHFFTHLHYEVPPGHPDVEVPRRLLARLGLQHHLIACPDVEQFRSDPDPAVKRFRDLYRRNVSGAHDVWAPIAYAMHRNYPADRLCVKGNLSEISRCSYYKHGYPERVDAELLARKTKMLDEGEPNPFALEQFDRWLAEARPAAEAHGYEILDLVKWEQRSRWQAQDQTERDIVQEAYTPFMNRELQSTMLGVDARYRGGDVSVFHRGMMKQLWSEVLDEPINPRNRSLLKKLGTRLGRLLPRLRSS